MKTITRVEFLKLRMEKEEIYMADYRFRVRINRTKLILKTYVLTEYDIGALT